MASIKVNFQGEEGILVDSAVKEAIVAAGMVGNTITIAAEEGIMTTVAEEEQMEVGTVVGMAMDTLRIPLAVAAARLGT